jgi:hypothetical protein
MAATAAHNGKHEWNARQRQRAERRLGEVFRKAIRELNRCYLQSCQDQKRIGAVLRELGKALRRYHGKGLR